MIYKKCSVYQSNIVKKFFICIDSFIEQNNINLLLRFVPKIPFVMFPNRFWQKIDGQKWVDRGVMTL